MTRLGYRFELRSASASTEVAPGGRRAVTVDVPADVASGTASIHLELPDGSSSLAADPRFSVRMSNDGTWRPVLGTNDLGLDVTVSDGNDR